MPGSLKNERDRFLPCETWSGNYEQHIGKMQFKHAQISHILESGVKKYFHGNFLKLQKFHWKTMHWVK